MSLVKASALRATVQKQLYNIYAMLDLSTTPLCILEGGGGVFSCCVLQKALIFYRMFFTMQVSRETKGINQ